MVISGSNRVAGEISVTTLVLFNFIAMIPSRDLKLLVLRSTDILFRTALSAIISLSFSLAVPVYKQATDQVRCLT